MSLSADIKELSLELGFASAGIASARPLAEAQAQIMRMNDEGLIPREFRWDGEVIRSFCDPASFVPGARAVIITTLSYRTEEEENPGSPGNPFGAIAPFTRRNYYRETKKGLEKIVSLLKNSLPSVKCHIASCGILREKPFAVRSGTGYYGNSGIIITKQAGSMVVLGAVITDAPLDEDEPLESGCGRCERCIRSCPTGAIVSPGVVDINRCLQYVSVKETIPVHYRELWGNRLYGCATCQQVCPKNNNVKPRRIEFSSGEVGPGVALIPLLSLSDEEFRETFRGNQIGARWISPNAIRKNACVALGNSGDPAALDALEGALIELPDSVKEHAAWALKKIGGKKASAILQKAMKTELSEELKEKIRQYL